MTQEQRQQKIQRLETKLRGMVLLQEVAIRRRPKKALSPQEFERRVNKVLDKIKELKEG